MADFSDVTRAIELELEKRKRKVRNRNAFDALIGALAGAADGHIGPCIEGLRKIFMGGGEAVEKERQRLALDAVLELVCKMDEALSDANAATAKMGSGLTLSGLVEVIAQGGDRVVGASIDPSAGPVTFAAGFRIRTQTENVRHTTGLHIGGRGGNDGKA